MKILIKTCEIWLKQYLERGMILSLKFLEQAIEYYLLAWLDTCT